MISDSGESKSLYIELLQLHEQLDRNMLASYARSLPINEELGDRWVRAKRLGFGQRTSIYDSCLVYGPPEVGSDCWIGPFCILDGSGGLTIGDWVTISSGVHIYTHDSVRRALSAGREPILRAPVRIGSQVYLGPNCLVGKGVTIGKQCVVGAFSFVNRDVPDGSIVVGQPARIVGTVEDDGNVTQLRFQRRNDESTDEDDVAGPQATGGP